MGNARKRVSPEDSERMRQLRKGGMTIAAVAKKLGVSTVTVCDHTVPGHLEKRTKASRDFSRRRLLYTDGGMVKDLSKRPYPDVCELCGVEKLKGLAYHHWDPGNPGLGIWLCNACHRVAEFLDRADWNKVAETYLALKEHIRKHSWDTE